MKITMPQTNLIIPRIIIGCMRINKAQNVDKFIEYSLDQGLNFFDHADIYGAGECEKIFATSIKNLGVKREDLILQSKCGIKPGVAFDFSFEHIVNSVDGILKRLNTEYLDILLLHRPDVLMETYEIAAAFEKLYKSGKVKYFGVSNQNPYMIQRLQKCTNLPIITNQLQFSLAHATMISQTLEMNMVTNGSVNRDGEVLDFMALNDISLQAWSPFQYGFFEGIFLNNEKFAELNKQLEIIANKYNTNKAAVATAWILRQNASNQVVLGTFNIDHFKETIEALKFSLTRDEWYKLYVAAGNILP